MKELIEKLKAANDVIERANELSEAERIALLQQMINILMTLLLASLRKNTS